MSYEIKIIVTSQKGVLDPEARTIEKCINDEISGGGLGIEKVGAIERLIVGRYFQYISKQPSKELARQEAVFWAENLFANMIIQSYEVESIKRIRK
ncbi:phosphoribosylformylglycinamidine synthase subunit PurS [Candidatus Woesearchaeota archaeon]|nr:phosphoribosylformylglycinamidine synthase subunit PurS [Candidatus Woesearchaeota archaeon]